MSVRLYALPEYEPPRRSVPPGPDELDDLLDLPPYTPPAPVPPPANGPVWDEPGHVRDQLCNLIRLVLEVLDGLRPITQLQGLVDAHTYASLLTRSRSTAGAHRHHLRTLHTCRPTPTVIELCATIAVAARHPRVIALTARLTSFRGHWLCTFLRPLYPQTPTPTAHHA
jgi:hypothetical protein